MKMVLFYLGFHISALAIVQVTILIEPILGQQSDRNLTDGLRCSQVGKSGDQICEGKSEDYLRSEDAIKEFLKQDVSGRTFGSTTWGGSSQGWNQQLDQCRSQPGYRGATCGELSIAFSPTYLRNTYNQQRYIVQRAPYQQTVNLKICGGTEQCGANAYYRGKCQQRSGIVSLLSWDPFNARRGVYRDTFRLPTCCVCQRTSGDYPWSNPGNPGQWSNWNGGSNPGNPGQWSNWNSWSNPGNPGQWSNWNVWSSGNPGQWSSWNAWSSGNPGQGSNWNTWSGGNPGQGSNWNAWSGGNPGQGSNWNSWSGGNPGQGSNWNSGSWNSWSKGYPGPGQGTNGNRYPGGGAGWNWNNGGKGTFWSMG